VECSALLDIHGKFVVHGALPIAIGPGLVLVQETPYRGHIAVFNDGLPQVFSLQFNPPMTKLLAKGVHGNLMSLVGTSHCRKTCPIHLWQFECLPGQKCKRLHHKVITENTLSQSTLDIQTRALAESAMKLEKERARRDRCEASSVGCIEDVLGNHFQGKKSQRQTDEEVWVAVGQARLRLEQDAVKTTLLTVSSTTQQRRTLCEFQSILTPLVLYHVEPLDQGYLVLIAGKQPEWAVPLLLRLGKDAALIGEGIVLGSSIPSLPWLGGCTKQRCLVGYQDADTFVAWIVALTPLIRPYPF
jgi:hypothetical protein